MMRAVLKETVPQMQQIVVDYKREVSKAKVSLLASSLWHYRSAMWTQLTVITRTHALFLNVSGDRTI